MIQALLFIVTFLMLNVSIQETCCASCFVTILNNSSYPLCLQTEMYDAFLDQRNYKYNDIASVEKLTGTIDPMITSFAYSYNRKNYIKIELEADKYHAARAITITISNGWSTTFTWGFVPTFSITIEYEIAAH